YRAKRRPPRGKHRTSSLRARSAAGEYRPPLAAAPAPPARQRHQIWVIAQPYPVQVLSWLHASGGSTWAQRVRSREPGLSGLVHVTRAGHLEAIVQSAASDMGLETGGRGQQATRIIQVWKRSHCGCQDQGKGTSP